MSALDRFPHDADGLIETFDLPDDVAAKVRPGLVQLLEALREEPLNASGVARARAMVEDDLSRLQAIVADRARYPEIAAVEIRQPLFILGLPRCGTSVLHALIGADPQIRTPLQWEVNAPSPPPGTPGVDVAQRVADYDAHLRRRLGPAYDDMQKAHPFGPMIPQECGSFMTTSFESSNPVMSYRIPQFYEWFLSIEADFRYEVHKMWLQHLGWRTGRRHWVLKIQEHMYKMPALRRVYPDAVFVQPHRDPTTVIASISQLILTLRSPGYDSQDRRALGREMLRLWHDGSACLMRHRAEHPDLPILDLRYQELVADPVGAIEGIYRRFGWDFTPQSGAAILGWLGDNPAGKHGKHRYTLEDFDLTAADVRDVYSDYIEAYRDYI